MRNLQRGKKILAIETSCDDTAVAVLDNHRILSSLVSSQEKLHANFGGVVPEVASREHLKAIYPLVDKALRSAKLAPKDVGKIAVTAKPGLLGSLLVGINAAKTLGYLWNKPVVEVDHLLGHAYSAFIDNRVEFPAVGLITSGGHTEIVLMKKHGDYRYLGGTRDDAAGEAFDKAARILGLGYPGGPAISGAATKGKPGKVKLPRPMMERDDLDFSFSGLKTAVQRVKGSKADIAYEFQEAVVDVLTDKLMRAARQHKAKTVILGGGVAANRRLRSRLQSEVSQHKVKLVIPDLRYCTDNAAMIGTAAQYMSREGTKVPSRRS